MTTTINIFLNSILYVSVCRSCSVWVFVACDGERKRSQRPSATCCPLRLPLDRYCRRPSLTCAAANAALRNRSLLLHTQKARAAVRDLRGRWGWDGHKLKMSERLANTSADTLTLVAGTRSKFITCFLICGWLTVFVCVCLCVVFALELVTSVHMVTARCLYLRKKKKKTSRAPWAWKKMHR